MTLSKAEQIEALETRRDAILTQLGELTDERIGGGPDTSGPGNHVRQVAYRRSLYEELQQIERSLALVRGPWTVQRQGRLA